MRSEDGGCYFWSYEEDWEVRAVYNPKFRYDPTTDEVVDLMLHHMHGDGVMISRLKS